VIARDDPLAKTILLALQPLQSEQDLGAAQGAPLALLLELGDACVVACAVGSSETVTGGAKLLEYCGVLGRVLLYASDSPVKTIEITTQSVQAARQCHGSDDQERKSNPLEERAPEW
jgi:hypothetical protein